MFWLTRYCKDICHQSIIKMAWMCILFPEFGDVWLWIEFCIAFSMKSRRLSRMVLKPACAFIHINWSFDHFMRIDVIRLPLTHWHKRKCHSKYLRFIHNSQMNAPNNFDVVTFDIWITVSMVIVHFAVNRQHNNGFQIKNANNSDSMQ